jgi:molecular chaperone DnaK
VYSTLVDNQEAVEVEVFQGENAIAQENVPLGDFKVEGLPPKPAGGLQVEVHFDFDINGILTVTATEKGKGQQGSLIVNNSGVSRLSGHELHAARTELESLFQSDEAVEVAAEVTESARPIDPELAATLDRAQQALDDLEDEQAEELQDLLDQIATALADEDTETLAQLQEEVEDFFYYLDTDDTAD